MARRKYGKTWWGAAWVEAMERIDCNTNRLPRGRSYAGGGRVSEIKTDPEGKVLARVKGSRATPYKIEIKFRGFSRQEMETVAGIIAGDPALAAELSMGRLPEKVLQLLKMNNIALLPEAWSDITARCSCPDWANPCKHLAAVYYIMANEIDKDPFILFKLRSIDAAELMQAAGFANREPGAGSFRAEAVSAGALSFVPYQEFKVSAKDCRAEEGEAETAEAPAHGPWGPGEKALIFTHA